VAPEPPPPAPRPVPPPRAVPDRPAPARPARVDTFRQPERQPERLEPRPSASMTMLATPEPAGFGPRLVAGVIDAALTGVGEALLIGPVAWYWWTREIPRSPQDVSFVSILASLVAVIAGLLLGFAYYVYFWGVRGATPGKQLLELAVEGEDGRYPIGTGKALARVLGYMLSSATLGIGFLMIAFGGSGLHDRVAGTRVVRRTRA